MDTYKIIRRKWVFGTSRSRMRLLEHPLHEGSVHFQKADITMLGVVYVLVAIILASHSVSSVLLGDF